MWTNSDGTKTYDTIDDFPEGSIGFIYLIEFTSGDKYIGQKQLYSTKTLVPKKNGEQREGGVFSRKKKNGVFEQIEKVTTQSNWIDYKGSSVHCKNLEPSKKVILAVAKNKLELTYLEVRELFTNRVLEGKEYLNENILGKFYKGRFDNLE